MLRLEISTDGVAERDRFDAWSAAIFSTLAISLERRANADGPFRARCSGRGTGSLLHCRFDADGATAKRKNFEIAHRPWDSYWLYRESAAGSWFRIDGQEMTSRPGDLVVCDGDIPFESHAIDGCGHEIWVLPKALIDPHLPALRRPLMTVLHGRSGVDALAASYLDALACNWDSIPEASMGQLADTLARLLGIACGATTGEGQDAILAGRLVQAKRHIDRHLADPGLSPASAAAALGISLRTLHALFEPTGISFTRHVQRRRLAECRAALLANPTRPVTDIAFAWGFTNLSSFYRAFQATFAMSPTEMRAASSGDHDDGFPLRASGHDDARSGRQPGRRSG